MKYKSTTSMFLMAAMLLLSGYSSLLACNILPPDHLKGSVEYLEKLPVRADFQLTWTISPNTILPHYFNVYMGVQTSNGHVDIKKIGVVKSEDGKYEYDFRLEDVDSGFYKFYVTSVIEENGVVCESKPSGHIVLEVKKDDNHKKGIWFINLPKPGHLEVGQTYTFRIVADSDVDCPIKYAIKETNIESGFRFHAESGEFTWTVLSEGEFYIVFEALLECDETVRTIATVKFFVKDEKPLPTAIIKGTATWADGSRSIPQGHLVAWQAKTNTNAHGVPVLKTELENGTYEFKVVPGAYYVQIMGDDFFTEFWDDAENINNATLIEVADNEVFSADFELERLPEEQVYVVSGTVVDDETGEPVQSKIIFTAVRHNMDRGKTGKPNSKAVTVETNSEGSYEVKLSNRYAWLAQALPSSNTGYKPQFFELADSPSEADLLYLHDDRGGVNFRLKNLTKFHGSLSGTVTGDNGNYLHAKVLAFMLKDQNVWEKNNVIVAETDRSGNFYMNNMPTGKYVLFSIPEDGRHIPGYYKENDFAVLDWQDATVIGVSQMGPTMMYEIKLRLKTEINGIGSARGNIGIELDGIDIDNKSDGSSIRKYYPAEGAYVYIEDASGNIVGNDITYNDGSYFIDGLEEGSYTIHADKVGLQHGSVTFEIDYEEQPESSEMIVMQKAVISGVEVLNDGTLTAYPVPANGVINLSVGEKNLGIVMIYGPSGRLINTHDANNMNEFRIDTGALGSGLYFIRAEVNGKIHTMSIPILK